MGRVEKLRFSSAQLRREGKCPLTPEEAGLFLAALGSRPSTPLYIATYQVSAAPLHRHLPGPTACGCCYPALNCAALPAIAAPLPRLGWSPPPEAILQGTFV